MAQALFPRLSQADEAPAVRMGGRSLNYRELAGAAAALAARLTGHGRVAVLAEPTVEFCVAVVGAVAAGATVVPVNPGSGERELSHVVRDSQPELVLVGGGGQISDALAGLPTLEVDASARGGSLPDEHPDEGVALVLYTSGTTGPPKGAQITKRAIASNLDALAEIWQWRETDRLAHALPMFHVHGLVLGMLGPLRAGGSLEHVGRFSPDALAGALTEGATIVFGVPTMYHRITEAARADRSVAEAFARARLLVSGSAALPSTDHERVRELTGQVVHERYGMTETLITAGSRVGEPVRAGRVGPPLPGVEIQLLDDGGVVIDAHDDATIGELRVRGPNVFPGYLNQPPATDDGWFRTGDLATRDESGSLRIVGRRATDLIKSGGYRIGAGEIEGALLEHPAVAEAAVRGLPDEDLGERVAAWVVLEPDERVSAAALSAHVEELLSRHKRPREVHFVSELPRNELGKVIKGALSG